MEEFVFTSQITTFMIAAVVLAGIPLAVATVTGLIVAILQAVTQIQDQTLSQTIKISAIAFVLLSASSTLSEPLMTATETLFDTFDTLVK